MTTYVPPKQGVDFVTYTNLVSQADTKKFQVNPTLAAGDVKISIDGGTLTNIATLPTVTPAGGTQVKITLLNSSGECSGANVNVVFIDVVGAEWCDQSVVIPFAARQIDDLSYPATSGRSTNVSAGGVVDADMVKINTDATSAANLAKTTRDILRGTAAGTSTVSITTSAFDITTTDADQLKGRIITFDPGTVTTGLRGQATDITASTASATPTFTVTALTHAPQAGDTFSIT